MPTYQEVDEQFRRDITEHELTVIRDDGDYRHLRFKRDGTNCMYFDLVTWPGHLCFTGDMGTYVFARVRDMFTFFRCDRDGLSINPPYWSEKVLAKDRDGVTQWSPRRFREMAIERIHEYFEDGADKRDDALRELTENVLGEADEEWLAVNSYLQFSFDGFQTEAEDLSSCYEYTLRYLWCCFAIVWGIQQYDQQAESQTAEEGVA